MPITDGHHCKFCGNDLRESSDIPIARIGVCDCTGATRFLKALEDLQDSMEPLRIVDKMKEVDSNIESVKWNIENAPKALKKWESKKEELRKELEASLNVE